MELVKPRLRLREFVEAVFQAFREMVSRPEMLTYEKELPREAETRESLAESISSQREIPRTVYKLAVTIPQQDTVIGLLKLSRRWEAIREWEIGWAIHLEEWGQGYATEAAWHMIDWAFSELKTHRVVAFCHALNASSVRVMEKLGMHKDGRLRETRWLKGEWWDEYVYAILERDWKSNKGS